MKEFDYAEPRTEDELVAMLATAPGDSEILAGGTDLIGLMKNFVVAPRRVVNVLEVESMQGVRDDADGFVIGAATLLGQLKNAPELERFPAVAHVLDGIGASLQFLSQGTVGGELCQRPACWYFRSGHGLLANSGRRVNEGDSRFHAILGNTGPAKFVSASRLAPALIALDARLRIVGPSASDESYLPLEFFYRTPRTEQQRENVLEPRQVVTHVVLPHVESTEGSRQASASYEVRPGAGPEDPLAAASVSLTLAGDTVREARVVLGQVAPVPWVSPEAAAVLVGQRIDASIAEAAGDAAVAKATPLHDNDYKVQLARVAVKRAILRAAGLETGGF